MKLRVKFAKTGNMKFIGHLDIMRYFQKAMRRADIPIKYSEGFSPHQIMSFAAPLGIGLESTGEYFDMALCDDVTDPDLKSYKDRLNGCMCPGMEILDLKVLDEHAVKAMAAVGQADYEVEGCVVTPEMADRIHQHRYMNIMKRTKSDDFREVDLTQFIYDFVVDGDVVRMRISQGSNENIKPETVLNAIGIFGNGQRNLPENVRITRTEIRDAEGKSLIYEGV